jgi:hypothetical protein
MEHGIEIIAAVCLIVTGMSHVVRPRAWVDFFVALRERGEAGVLVVALLHVPLGVFIVAFHNRWSGIGAVVTVLGYAWLLKATLYFTFPQVGLMSLGRVSVERAHYFVIAGWLSIGLGALVAYSLLVG